MDAVSTVFFVGGITAIGVIVGYMIWASVSFAPWIPSSRKMVQKALDYIKPDRTMKFVDLGCGDGRIVCLASEKYGLTAYGYELSILPYFFAQIRRIFHRELPISIERKNLYASTLSEFDIIYFYGLPEKINRSLLPKLKREVKPGSYIISYNFSIPEKIPLKIFRDKWRNIFIYRW